MSTLFIALTWWQMVLLGIYTIYTLVRGIHYFNDGVKETLIGYRKNTLRLYHIILLVIDIPSMILGRFYHVIKFIFSAKLYTFKEKKEKENG